MLFETTIYERFVSFGTNRVFEPGESLTVQGEPFQNLYLIRSGTVDVTVETSHGEKVRLKSMGSGSSIGEISMYLGGATTAHVVARSQTETLAFSQAELDRMRTEAPDVYAVLHEVRAHTLATRLADSSRLIDMLLY
jgi:CRP-like cAMP-binding protein